MRQKPKLIALSWGVALLGAALLGGAAVAQEKGADDRLNDPLAVLAKAADDTGRAVLTAFPAYDHATITKAVTALEKRAGSDKAREHDDYLIAQGYLEIATIRRFFEKQAEDDMPEVLDDLDPIELTEKGLAPAARYSEAHPEHSDIHRVMGELKALQIRGMISGMTKGPEALESMSRASRLDPKNGWAVFASGRMHYHNPAIAGGDKDLALKELRQVVKSIQNWRVYHYLSLTYDAKDMLSQAYFWARKASKAAPKNPEVAHQLAAVVAKRAEEEE